MLKEDAKKLQQDFIPGGAQLSRDEVSKLEFRRTLSHEILQCCVKTQYDMQSGPIYCGRVSEWVAYFKDGMLVALCGKRGHTPDRIKMGV